MELFETADYGIARVLVDAPGQNYNFIVWCQKTAEAAVIDPTDAQTVLRFIADRGLVVRYVINTHAHPDHTSGNDAVIKVSLASFDTSRASMILVHPAGKHLVAPRSGSIDEGDSIELGEVRIGVLHTPGHCPEHVTLLLDGYAFVGDTLFSGGCGNTTHGGDVDELYASITGKLAALPDETKIFYGHEYTVNNLKFALDLEPGNAAVSAKLAEVEAMAKDGSCPPPPTLGEEKTYNPFLRTGAPELVAAVRDRVPGTPEDPREVFRAVRKLKDEW